MGEEDSVHHEVNSSILSEEIFRAIGKRKEGEYEAHIPREEEDKHRWKSRRKQGELEMVILVKETLA